MISIDILPLIKYTFISNCNRGEFMIYNNFCENRVSALGMGCMRLPVKDDVIDEAAVAEMVEYALSNGINYFDTAWGYHGGQSEIVMGRVLSKYPRESFYLATKFPGYDVNNMAKVEEIFARQLEKTGAGYFDYYLIHNVCEKNIEEYLDPKFGILEYLLKKKDEGIIRHLGFSVHGNSNTFDRFMDAYGEHMEFCQIQLNYIDWDFQNARYKVEYLNERNIPVIVMEPLRGGKLATLSDEDTVKLHSLRPDASVPEWAFRYVQSVPGVAVTLSGMSDMAQLRENIAIFDTYAPINEKERGALTDIGKKLVGCVPCTACSYCVDHCPQGLDIPTLLNLYNEQVFTGGGFIVPMTMSKLSEDKKPAACIGCRSCEAVCPQVIKISEVLSDFAERIK